jgi:hypothetical protein
MGKHEPINDVTAGRQVNGAQHGPFKEAVRQRPKKGGLGFCKAVPEIRPETAVISWGTWSRLTDPFASVP